MMWIVGIPFYLILIIAVCAWVKQEIIDYDTTKKKDRR